MELEANGETLHYVMEGRGPAIVFAHGIGSDSYVWHREFAALKDRYACIAFDMRGFGWSSFNGRWTAGAAAEDLHAGLTALGVERAHLVGFAAGGPVTLTFNAKYPKVARSLVLIDTFARNHSHSQPRIEESEKCFRYMSMREYARQYAATRLLPDTPQAEFNDLVAAMCLSRKEAYMDVLRGILLPDFRPLCALVKVPTLVVCGAHDRTTPPNLTTELTQLIGGAVERLLPTGHFPNYDDPALLTRTLVEFLDAQPR
jgi:3-oxoadipate enol-lactonase